MWPVRPAPCPDPPVAALRDACIRRRAKPLDQGVLASGNPPPPAWLDGPSRADPNQRRAGDQLL